MAIRDADLERLREQVAVTIGRATDLLAALNALDDGLAALMPALARLPEAERLADLVAGLTTGEGAQAWVRVHWARLEAGDEPEAA
jgi:hypothetical protein